MKSVRYTHMARNMTPLSVSIGLILRKIKKQGKAILKTHYLALKLYFANEIKLVDAHCHKEFGIRLAL